MNTNQVTSTNTAPSESSQDHTAQIQQNARASAVPEITNKKPETAENGYGIPDPHDVSQECLDNTALCAEDRELKSGIESLLFIAGNPLSLERLSGIFEHVSIEKIEAEIEHLKQDYEARYSGIMLTEVAGGYQLVTRPQNAEWIRKFISVKVSSRLSRPALETLAIVAYKQPITRAEIELIRGVNIGGIIRNLMERRLVKIVGKKDVPGKPMMYGTTADFLQYFGLKDLSSLPTLKEFQDLESSEEVMEPASLEPETDPDLSGEGTEPVASPAEIKNIP
ncbi:MAG: SMC-Scp complex subunit ScpB [Nitrospirota bacterium]